MLWNHEPLATLEDGYDVVTRAAEQEGKRLDDARLVLGDQHTRHGLSPRACGTAAGGSGHACRSGGDGTGGEEVVAMSQQPAPSIETSNRIFTIPNVISFIRLLGVPLFLYLLLFT